MQVIEKGIIKEGQRVLVRASFNVALDSQQRVIDDLRLRRTIDTVETILRSKGIPILISHIKNDQGSTLEPIKDWFQDRGYQTELVKDYYPFRSAINNFQADTIYIFENLRAYPGEEANDSEFAKGLSKYGDIYVNESFDSAHRLHASVVTLPTLLPAYAGCNFYAEVQTLSKVFNPSRPFTFIIGGAKIETKAPLIRKLLDKADRVFVGGALMNPLLALQGYQIGQSLMPKVPIDLSDIAEHPNVELPVDFIDQNKEVIDLDMIRPETQLMDIGPESLRALDWLIEESALVVWNGPLGNYELGFGDSTDRIASKLGSADCYSIIGGGDTLAAVDDTLEREIEWISTGGGSMLDFIESDGQLPTIEVLQ